MTDNYAKIVVLGSPISKSNFKLFNIQGRAIMPINSGKYHDRYAIYEEHIAYEARLQNPKLVLSESLIAVLKVFYKSKKRHPDTNNITKSIFDGIEKSGLIINDAQIRRLIIEEFYDRENPRFELELFAESTFSINYNIVQVPTTEKPIIYNPPPNRKKSSIAKANTSKDENLTSFNKITCDICNKKFDKNQLITANNKKTFICKKCFNKLF